jgi:hypothetical protein
MLPGENRHILLLSFCWWCQHKCCSALMSTWRRCTVSYFLQHGNSFLMLFTFVICLFIQSWQYVIDIFASLSVDAVHWCHYQLLDHWCGRVSLASGGLQWPTQGRKTIFNCFKCFFSPVKLNKWQHNNRSVRRNKKTGAVVDISSWLRPLIVSLISLNWRWGTSSSESRLNVVGSNSIV